MGRTLVFQHMLMDHTSTVERDTTLRMFKFTAHVIIYSQHSYLVRTMSEQVVESCSRDGACNAIVTAIAHLVGLQLALMKIHCRTDEL